jgi:hypothetical protein
LDFLVYVKKDGIDGGDVLDVYGVIHGDPFKLINKSIISIKLDLNSEVK